MGKLKDLEIPDSFILQLEYESKVYKQEDSEYAIARILIEDHIYDEATRDYLFGYVEDTLKETGDVYLLIRLYQQVRP